MAGGPFIDGGGSLINDVFVVDKDTLLLLEVEGHFLNGIELFALQCHKYHVSFQCNYENCFLDN